MIHILIKHICVITYLTFGLQAIRAKTVNDLRGDQPFLCLGPFIFFQTFWFQNLTFNL